MKQKAHRRKTRLSIGTFVIYLPQWRLRKELLPRFTIQTTSNNDKGNQSINQKLQTSQSKAFVDKKNHSSSKSGKQLNSIQTQENPKL